MGRIYLRWIFLFIPLYSLSQYTIQPVFSLWQPLYGYSIEQKNVIALQDNIASVVKMNSFEFGIYGERRFLIETLSFYQAFVAAPTSYGNFSLKASMFSYPQFNNILIGAGYGKRLNKIADCGFQFLYQSLNIPGYYQRRSIGAELGMIFHLSEELNTGLSVKNINGHTLKNNNGLHYPLVYSAGIGHDASKQVYFGMEIKKITSQPAETNISLHYNVHNKIKLGLCMSPSAMNGSFSAGLSMKDFQLCVITNLHQLLGITPALLISYSKKKQ